MLVADTPDEGDGELGINLTLSTPSEKQISGNIILEPGNAFSPALRAQTLPFEIPAGQNNLRLIVPIDDDEFDEFDETFTLSLDQAQNANTPQNVFEGSIRNDDPATEIRLAAGEFDEGDTGETTIQVLLDRPSGKPIAFDFALGDDSTQQGVDWQGEDGQARIVPGVQSLISLLRF